MKDIVTVVGARPQFVKASVVSRALEEAGIRERLVHTGQHYDNDMSAVFFNEMEIPAPDVYLGVGSGSHAMQTGAMMTGLEKVLLSEARPDAVLVYGDTNSTLAGAVTARKLHLPVVHVEAGLRSFNDRMPEEINRIITDRLSSVLFCPTQTAAGNLAAEGILEGVHVTGDVMYDATVHFCARADVKDLDRPKNSFYVATVHRAENTDQSGRLASIVEAFGRLPGRVVFPVHPRTRGGLEQMTLPSNVELRPPQSYLSMLRLVRGAERVLTDSGGLQKEAVWLGTPCVTLRAETEWVETLAGGWNILADADPDRIVRAALSKPDGPPPAVGVVDGLSASRRVASILART